MIKQTRVHPMDWLARLEEEYRTIVPPAEQFCEELARQIGRLLDGESITLGFPLQHRVKTWSSVILKLERLHHEIKSIATLQDLVGVRIILLFRRDAVRTCELIEHNFTVQRQYNTQERLGADQFGYASIHFVTKLPEAWLAVPTLSEFKDFRAEIQVRTLPQHIWAEASQVLQYKQEESVPPTIRRTVARVAALLETVDLELERTLSEREQYRETLKESKLDEVLNVDVLENLLDSRLPPSNKQPGLESYAVLLLELSHVGITHRQPLEKLMEEHYDEALQEDAAVAVMTRAQAKREGA